MLCHTCVKLYHHPSWSVWLRGSEWRLPLLRLSQTTLAQLIFVICYFSWNSLDEDTRSISNYEIFKDTLMGNVNDNALFHLGARQEQIIMARLRMSSSDLKGRLYSMKMIESSACPCGLKIKMKFISF